MISSILKLSTVLALLGLSGCESIKPLVEVSHTSHITQHFGKDRTNYGYNVVSVGVRARPARGVVIDIMDGYSGDELDSRHEVFQARLEWEIGHHD